MDTMLSKIDKFYHIGFSLASNSSHTSSVCVLDKNKNIVLLDKLYFADDILLFFEQSSYMQNSILIAGLVPDESLLEGKWRIHSKNYKPIENRFEINRNNWTNRLNSRMSDKFFELNKEKCTVYRCNLDLLRQSYGLKSDYLSKTALDCKSFQLGLKIKYGFNMPENLLPSSSLEAVLYAMFGFDIGQNKVQTQEIGNYKGLKILNKLF